MLCQPVASQRAITSNSVRQELLLEPGCPVLRVARQQWSGQGAHGGQCRDYFCSYTVYILVGGVRWDNLVNKQINSIDFPEV